MQFIVRRIFQKDIEKEVQKTGFSPEYLGFGVQKHKFLNIKISNLTPPMATLIKQTALSNDSDAAVHKNILIGNIDNSNIVLSGTEANLKKIAEKLKVQQFQMPKIAAEILKQIEISNAAPKKPKIMGILNVTENSFSDGGKFLDPKNALEHAQKMIEEGAEIIDIGAESTRPGADWVPSEIEIQRLPPVVWGLKNSGAKISIDTRNSDTARVAADLGCSIINDVSGLKFDQNMAKTVAEAGIEVIIGHTRGTPKEMDNLANYKDTIEEIYIELNLCVQNALEAGIAPEKIIIDPGFGFAKNTAQNFEILNKIEEFKSLGYRICAGLSRKKFLRSIVFDEGSIEIKNLDEKNLKEIDTITGMAVTILAEKNIDIIRVHDVSGAKAAVNLIQAMKNS